LFSTYRIGPEGEYFGIYREYYLDGRIKIEGEYLFYGNNINEYYKPGNCTIKNGVWKYYKKNGKLKKTKYYRNNKKIKKHEFVINKS